MNILIAGASGFIGRELINALKLKYQITALGRNSALLKQCFPQQVKIATWDQLTTLNAHSYEAIINLCGHNIGASRWNAKVKHQLIDSRVQTSADLINWVIQQKAKPRIYCANAVGIYGVQKKDDLRAFDENTPINFNHPPDFLSEIGIRWQQALQPALDQGLPVIITRFGVALKKGKGMLKKLSPAFYLGLGAILGDGKQMLSWVHSDDIVGAYLFLLKNTSLTGEFNITSPFPVNQAQFARTLAKVMHRPLFFKIPALVIRALLGEMGEYLLLQGQRVVPKRLLDEGYQFLYPELEQALRQEFKPE